MVEGAVTEDDVEPTEPGDLLRALEVEGRDLTCRVSPLDLGDVFGPRVGGEDLAAAVFEKTRLREGRTGNALEVARVNAPDVSALALSAARALKLVGPLDMDIRRDINGVAHILEINARIGAHTQRAPEIFDALVELYDAGDLGG